MKIVIIGGGQAGGWAARTITGLDAGHEVVLIGEEPHPPYERPPLSKDVLLGAPYSQTYMWSELPGVETRKGIRATGIDRVAKTVSLTTGEAVAYDRLILATGGRVRTLDLPGTRYLRTIEDSIAIAEAMGAASSMLVIGGGWIGLEVAAAARSKGLDVCVVEAADRLCSRVMPPIVSEYLHNLHARHGVDFHYRASPSDFARDIIVAGIGIAPNVELALEAGLAVADGIVVDEFGRTSDPFVYAAGDVACMYGYRIESWANAQNQAIAVAKSAAGQPTPYRDIPWFWSTQYDVNLQFLGAHDPEARIVVRGDPETDCFTIFFLTEQETLLGVVAVNAMRDIRASRKLMEQRARLDPELLSTSSVPLDRAIQPAEATA